MTSFSPFHRDRRVYEPPPSSSGVEEERTRDAAEAATPLGDQSTYETPANESPANVAHPAEPTAPPELTGPGTPSASFGEANPRFSSGLTPTTWTLGGEVSLSPPPGDSDSAEAGSGPAEPGPVEPGPLSVTGGDAFAPDSHVVPTAAPTETWSHEPSEATQDPPTEDLLDEVLAVLEPGSDDAEDEEADEPKRRPLPRVIALANQKGGVGKTTTTINLGAALAEQDHRTLVIDLDPQGNATTGLGINSRTLDHSIYDVLLMDVALEDCIEPTDVLNLFIAPANLDLAGAEIELVPAMSRETRLRKAIEEVKHDYDYILIDCPPSLGLLTVNGLAAADEVMVPVQCEYFALEGLGQLIRNINLVQRNLNPELELSSIVLVMYDGRTKLAEQVSAEVRDHFGSTVLRNVIPRNIRLSEAPSYGQPITTFDPSSRGAVAYRELAREVHRVST